MVDANYITNFEQRIGCPKPKYEMVPHSSNGSSYFYKFTIFRTGFFTDRIMLEVVFSGNIYCPRSMLHRIFRKISLKVGSLEVSNTYSGQRELEDILFPDLVRRIDVIGGNSYITYEILFKKENTYLLLPDMLEVTLEIDLNNRHELKNIFGKDVEILESQIMVEYLIHPIPQNVRNIKSVDNNMRSMNLYSWDYTIECVDRKYTGGRFFTTTELEYVFFRFYRNCKDNTIDPNLNSILVQIEGFDAFCIITNTKYYKTQTWKDHFSIEHGNGWYCIPLIHRNGVSAPRKCKTNWELKIILEKEIEPCEIEICGLSYNKVPVI